MPSTAELFDQVRERLASRADRLKNFKATFQIVLTGDDGGTFYIRVDNGTFDIGAGTLEKPECTIQLSADHFKAMSAGKATPPGLFFSGKAKVTGNLGLAMRMHTLVGE